MATGRQPSSNGAVLPPQLSPRAQLLLVATAVAYVGVGLPLFVAPGWASQHFAWKVSPFVAMTAGAWCLGTAAFALSAVRRRVWTGARPGVVFTFAFGVTELAIALYNHDRLITDETLSGPYLIAMGLSVIAGGLALVEGRSHLVPDLRTGLDLTPTMRRLRVGFVALLLFLAAIAFVAPVRATNGAVFPQPLSLFSLRAFGVFYLSLGVAMLAIIGDRHADAFLAFMQAGLVLVVPILLATAVYGGSFDLGEHPLQVVYPLAYVVALVGATGSLRWARGRPGR